MKQESLQDMESVVTIPAPGGELSILACRRFDETEKLKKAKSVLLDMIEAQSNMPNNINTTLLPSQKNIAEGISKVAEELNDIIKHRETAKELKRLNSFWKNPWFVGIIMLVAGLIIGRFVN